MADGQEVATTRFLTLTVALIAAPALAQMPVGGVVGMGAPGAEPTGALLPPGVTSSGLGTPMLPGSPAAAQPATGVIPPTGAATAGTIGDGRVGSLAPGRTVAPVAGTSSSGAPQ